MHSYGYSVSTGLQRTDLSVGLVINADVARAGWQAARKKPKDASP